MSGAPRSQAPRGRRGRLDALMPVAGRPRDAWKYYVPTGDTSRRHRAGARLGARIKLLDPACGSGHFLVIAFDLWRACKEEARHRGVVWSPEDISESILGRTCTSRHRCPRHQIAATALWLKAKLYAPEAKLGRMNSSRLRCGWPICRRTTGLETLRSDLEREVGIPKPVKTEACEHWRRRPTSGPLARRPRGRRMRSRSRMRRRR